MSSKCLFCFLLVSSLVLSLLLALLFPNSVASAPAAPSDLSKVSPDNNPLPAFKWNAASGAVSYEVRVDSGSWTNIGNKLTYVQTTVLSKGTHAFSVRALDTASNAGPEATLNFNVSVVADVANTKIAFQSERDGHWEVYVMNADGSNQIRLTNGSAKNISPTWGPDGRSVFFVSNRDGNDEIYVMNADGSNQTRLTNNPASDCYPVCSPDGSKIAFRSDRGGAYDIYVMNIDGSNPIRLTSSPADDSEPAWSPDGSKIVFFSRRDGNDEIYVMDADGYNQTRLTNNPAQDLYPTWSPDGSKILFASERSGRREFYVMNADGSNQILLTPNSMIDTWGFTSFSPDGSRIAFETNRDGNWEVYLMNADGSNQARLTDTPAVDAYAHWSPFLAPAAAAVYIPSEIMVLMNDGSVETMDLDEYVKGVVAGEMFSDWPIEALKAQAVAARTFAVKNTHYDHCSVDVCTDHNCCQSWVPPPYNTSIEEAVTSTHNQVITYGGQIITEALYFSHCDGHTRNSEDYDGWSYVPYLRSVACECGFTTHAAHGVGMCQYGAKAMAEQGSGYIDILKHYYTGGEVVSAGAGVVTATCTGTAGFQVSSGTMQNLTAVDENTLPIEGKPSLEFPHGFFSFSITGLSNGQTVTVAVELPSAVPVGTQYWKYGPTQDNNLNHWYQLPMGDDDGDNVITITLVDGGLGDDDLSANGIIVDQGGPGWPPTPTGGRGVPVFPSIYIGIGAAFAAVILAYFVCRRMMAG
jgi:Tol biopolymer transport system component